MSDAYYQERARRRARIFLLVGIVAAGVLVVLVVLWALFHDACTQSFDRSPVSVVSAYLTAVDQGNAPAAQECWEHDAYFDLNAGCSEICLSKVYGAQFEVQDISVGEPLTTPEGRANLPATISIACAGSGDSHTAEILLDSVGSGVPWKHWAIVRSTFGGTVVEPWCK